MGGPGAGGSRHSLATWLPADRPAAATAPHRYRYARHYRSCGLVSYFARTNPPVPAAGISRQSAGIRAAAAGRRVPVRQHAVHDTWAARDLPVLDATVSLLEESYMVTVSDLAARTGLDSAAVARALETLDPDYVDFRKTTTGGDPTFWYVLKVTPQARRAVGRWPTPDSFVTKLSAELSAAAGQEEDAERKSLLSYAARLIGDTLREAAVRAAGQVLAPALGPALAPSAPSRPSSDEQLPLAEAARAASSSSSA